MEKGVTQDQRAVAECMTVELLVDLGKSFIPHPPVDLLGKRGHCPHPQGTCLGGLLSTSLKCAYSQLPDSSQRILST